MNIKKIPYRAAPWFLMVGACLTIGLLSFGGMLALWPSVTLAVASFVLTVVYEGEIYLQSTKSALKKLFKSTYLERQLAKKCLLQEISISLLESKECPAFFKDYVKQLQQLHRFQDKRLDKDSQVRKKHVEKTLSDMEKWFAAQLFSDEPGKTEYQRALQVWFKQQKNKDGLVLKDAFIAKKASQQWLFQFINIFCIVAGGFTGIGTTYLLVDVFATIPILAAVPLATLPIIIVPMSLIAGVAYGLLVYNAATDMVANEMVLKWSNKIKEYRKEGLTTVNAIRALGLGAILSLNIILAICTAGTWWTVAKTTRPLFEWMNKLPAVIMFEMNPIISAVSMFIFNVDNVDETFEQLEAAITPESALDAVAEEVLPPVKVKIDQENKWQKLNPFRLFIAGTFEPLRIALFAGHITSISAAGDRVPGVKAWVSALFCGLNEFFEDLHWFNLVDVLKNAFIWVANGFKTVLNYFGAKLHLSDTTTQPAHKHDTKTLLKERLGKGEGHNHDADLPTKMLTFLYMPIYLLAASWDSICSRENKGELKKVDFWSSLDKAMGLPEVESVDFSSSDCCPINASTIPHKDARFTNLFNPNRERRNRNVLPNPSAWPAEHAAYRVDRHIEKCLQDVWFVPGIAAEQVTKLTGLKKELYGQSDETSLGIAPTVGVLINDKVGEPIYNQHHFFFNQSPGKTDTRMFLDNLPARVAQSA